MQYENIASLFDIKDYSKVGDLNCVYIMFSVAKKIVYILFKFQILDIFVVSDHLNISKENGKNLYVFTKD